MLEAVRAAEKTIDIDIVNRVLIQSNWLTLQIGGRWYGISKYRIYDFELGIFLQRDFLPLLNKYNAFDNDPVDLVDPLGLETSEECNNNCGCPSAAGGSGKKQPGSDEGLSIGGTGETGNLQFLVALGFGKGGGNDFRGGGGKPQPPQPPKPPQPPPPPEPPKNLIALGFGKGVADVGAAVGKGANVGRQGTNVPSGPVHIDVNDEKVRKVLEGIHGKYPQLDDLLYAINFNKAKMNDPKLKDISDIFKTQLEKYTKDLQAYVDKLVVQEKNEALRSAAILNFARTGTGNLSKVDQDRGYDLRQKVDFSVAAYEAYKSSQRGEVGGRGGDQTNGG
ncbi:MAG: hypothetical protein HY291_04975, partial [Planctomycetes bacterium]|nr:hypothetical protein [Planctomycetota bacterium]